MISPSTFKILWKGSSITATVTLTLVIAGVLATRLAAEPDSPNAMELASLLDGEFRTHAADSENQIIDRRIRVNALGEGVWLYAQINSGTDMKLYRQRIVQLFDTGENVQQRSYKLTNPNEHVDLWDKTEKIKTLEPSDIEPYLGSHCDMLWKENSQSEFLWHGKIDWKKCTLFSERRQANIHIGAEARIGELELLQTERGFSESGEQLFGTEPDKFLRLKRVTK